MNSRHQASMFKRISKAVATHGVGGFMDLLYRRVMKPEVGGFKALSARFQNAVGLEIGGPSSFFQRRGPFPVYPLAARVDNCNFGPATVWEGEITPGETFRFEAQRDPGSQYITEASSLEFARTESYDFVLSSHALEHMANPIKVLLEWKRVLKEGGTLAMVLPHRDGTFDHLRPVTTLAHLIDDFERNTGEDDLTHLDEILKLHDFERDPGASDRSIFLERSRLNFQNRCLHHHVFDTSLAIQLTRYAGFNIIAAEAQRPMDILLVAQPCTDKCLDADHSIRSFEQAVLKASPFRSDRMK